MKTKYNPKHLAGMNQSSSERRRIPMALVFAIGMTLLALSSKAGNILVNPGFESSVFASGAWTQHSLQTWSSGPASSVNGTESDGTPINIKLVRSGNDGLWMQGTYAGNGTGMPDESVSETFACFPGNAYIADAWYSAYLFCTNRIGGDDAQLEHCYGFQPPYAPTQGGGSGLFTGSGVIAQQDGWVEVRFLDSGNNVLSDYKSTIIDPAYLGVATDTNCYESNGWGTYTGTLPIVTNAIGNVYLAWGDYPVTNQYDITKSPAQTDPDTEIANGAITNTLGAGQPMVAPAGAAKVEFSIHIYQTGNSAANGAPFWDDATLNQVAGPSQSIITPTPSGLSFFTGATNFTFNVASASTGGAPLPTNSTSSVGIVVNGVNQTANLQFSGVSTNLTGTLQGMLASNSVYNITVNVTNSRGLVTSQNVTFDTFPTNPFVVSAEDYDYTNGQFFENPTPTAAPAPNSYYGTGGAQGVDLGTYNGGPPPSTELVRNDGRAVMQIAADIQLPIYAAQSNANVVNVQIAYNNPGNWFNYTRNYPTGNYLVFLRYNNPTANNMESLNVLTSGYGTATQTTNNLGEFIGANTGAGYAWVPLTDQYGNKIIVNLGTGQSTLQLLSGNGTTAGGIANFVDFILVPAGTSFPPVINNLNPNNVNPPVNGNVFMTNIPTISYSVGSTFSTVASSDIHTFINGIDFSSSATITGNNTNWSVSLPCPQNQLINLVITAKDANGLSNTLTETFDTFNQGNMMIEAVDFDFNGGQFIDNPVPTGPWATATNSYFEGGIYGTNAAVPNVDYSGFSDGGGEAWVYRFNDQNVGQETDNDFLRSKFTDATEMAETGGQPATNYDIGYWNGGFWENYTRTFPAGNYNVFGRMAGGAGPFSGTKLALVTSGVGTTIQTSNVLGTFADPNAAGWDTWHWVPMRDTNGNLATISLGGVQTLKLISGNNLNAEYLMFVQVVSLSPTLTISISGSSVSIHYPTVSGHNYTVQYNTTLSGGSWQTLSGPIAGDGTIKAAADSVSTGGPVRFYRLLIQ